MKIQDLTSHWKTIRDEAVALDKKRIHNLDRNGKTHKQVMDAVVELGPGWIRSYGKPKHRWLVWGICYEDDYPFGYAEMPKTASLLHSIQGIKVAAISWFRPNTELLPHRHPELDGDCLTYHLGLDVPYGCALVTGDGHHFEQDGKGIVFDGSKPHYAYNVSSFDRLILYCEFRP